MWGRFSKGESSCRKRNFYIQHRGSRALSRGTHTNTPRPVHFLSQDNPRFLWVMIIHTHIHTHTLSKKVLSLLSVLHLTILNTGYRQIGQIQIMSIEYLSPPATNYCSSVKSPTVLSRFTGIYFCYLLRHNCIFYRLNYMFLVFICTQIRVSAWSTHKGSHTLWGSWWRDYIQQPPKKPLTTIQTPCKIPKQSSTAQNR